MRTCYWSLRTWNPRGILSEFGGEIGSLQLVMSYTFWYSEVKKNVDESETVKSTPNVLILHTLSGRFFCEA